MARLGQTTDSPSDIRAPFHKHDHCVSEEVSGSWGGEPFGPAKPSGRFSGDGLVWRNKMEIATGTVCDGDRQNVEEKQSGAFQGSERGKPRHDKQFSE
eukprot:44963-Pleurochrysis_carterae.AAC.2